MHDANEIGISLNEFHKLRCRGGIVQIEKTIAVKTKFLAPVGLKVLNLFYVLWINKYNFNGQNIL